MKRKRKNKKTTSAVSKVASSVESRHEEETTEPKDYFDSLSLEIICHILSYLPLRHILRIDCMNHKMRNAVSMYLRVQKEIDMSEKEVYGWMCDRLTDSALEAFLRRCHDVEYLYGFHPGFMTTRRQRGVDMMTIPGIIDNLSLCKKLKGIELSDVVVLHAVMNFLPRLQILGTFKNRNGCFPINYTCSLTLVENAKIHSLHLNGIVLENLPKMYNLRHLQLRHVHLNGPNPFQEFMAPKLQTFVLAHCAGPINALKYVPLVASLASARNLTRLELLRVPFLGGLIHHVVQDSWQMNAFRQLRCMRFGACRHALEMDVGFLIITAAQKIEEISIQPSLTKDNMFMALEMANVVFPAFSTLNLGFVDSFPDSDKWSNEALVAEGLDNISEAPAVITDIGMKSVGTCFPLLKFLDIYNCPHIFRPLSWFSSGLNCWDKLTDLTLRRCHGIKLKEFCEFIPKLLQLQTLHLEHMFREPPKGCSRVGLSAGTGMGLSSAVLNQHYQNPAPVIPVVGNDNVNINVQADQADNPAVPIVDNNNESGDVHVDEADNPAVPIVDNNNVSEDVHMEQADNPAVPIVDNNNVSMDVHMEQADNPAVPMVDNNNKSGDVHMEQADNPAVPIGDNNDVNRDVHMEQVDNPALPIVDNNNANVNIQADQASNPNAAVLKVDNENVNKDVHMNQSCNHAVPIVVSNNVNKDVHMDQTDNYAVPILDSNNVNSNVHMVQSKNSSAFSVPAPAALDNNNVKMDVKAEQRDSHDNPALTMSSGIAENSYQNNNAGDCDEDVPMETVVLNPGQNIFAGQKPQTGHENEQEPEILCGDELEKGAGCDTPYKGIIVTECPVDDNIQACSKQSTWSPDRNTEDKELLVEEKRAMTESEYNQLQDDKQNAEVIESVGSHPDLNKPISVVNSKGSGSTASVVNKVISCDSTSSKQLHCKNLKSDTQTGEETDKKARCETRVRMRPTRSCARQSCKKSTVSNSEKKRKYLEVSPSAGNSSKTTKNMSSEDHPSKKKKEVSPTTCTGSTDTLHDIDNDKCLKCLCVQSETDHHPHKTSKSKTKRKRKKRSIHKRKLNCSCDCHLVSSDPRSTPNISQGTSVQHDKPIISQDTSVQHDKPIISQGTSVQDNKPIMSQSTSVQYDKPISEKVDKATQVKEEDIRQNMIKPEGVLKVNRRKRGRKSKESGYVSPKINMTDQSTSTSDPVIEDDHIQVLTVKSSSLIALSLNAVGITSLVIDNCPNLTKLSGHACRVLKEVKIDHAPKMSRVEFTHCKKLKDENLAQEVALQGGCNKTIFLRPMHQINTGLLEKSLFSSPDIPFSVCIVYDYNDQACNSSYNRMRVVTWPDIFTPLCSELIDILGFKEWTRKDWKPKYPWGRDIFRMYERNGNLTRYEMVTDMTWLRAVTECPRIPEKQIHRLDHIRGVYCPNTKGHYGAYTALDAIMSHIAEKWCEDMAIRRRSCVVYVNMSDTNGVPTFDPMFSGWPKN